MRLSRFFITRPIFAAVIAVVITIVGALAYWGLPVSQYPDIVPPTVTVTANYPGASAETVAETVAAPIEQEINGVDDMLYQSSQSTGDGTVTAAEPPPAPDSAGPLTTTAPYSLRGAFVWGPLLLLSVLALRLRFPWRPRRKNQDYY